MKPTALLISLFLLFSTTTTHARDPVAGKTKATQVCSVCHGADGMSTQPNAPNLAGQPAIYTTEQLKAFRAAKRQNEVMSVIAKSLTDADIDNLSVWYESIKVTAEVPK